MNRPLSADVHERSFPYNGRHVVAQALALDPALRSLPSDELARRFGTTRSDVEHAIRTLVEVHAGAFVQVSGRSFDEAIADVGHGRRPALTPEPVNEAAGFIPRRALMARPPPGRMRRASFGAAGYQPPPTPDLSAILLSDVFPTTRRRWTSGAQPTPDEVTILNWQHPLLTGQATGNLSAQSQAILNAMAQGARSWDQDVTLPGGKQLSGRSPDERTKWWNEMLAIAANTGWLIPPIIDPGDPKTGAPKQITMQYWDVSDGSHARKKTVEWYPDKLIRLSSGESLRDASWPVIQQISVDGSNDQGLGGRIVSGSEGYDVEAWAMKNFAGLIGAVGALGSAISTVVALYCPACGVALKIALQIAQKASVGNVATKALYLYGDLMLTDARTRALSGSPAAMNSLRQFAMALLGQPVTSTTSSTQAAGGITSDYLATLGTAYNNVPAALSYFANDHSNSIASSADLALKSNIPLEDCQYAVAALTDTLSRFSANLNQVYTPPSTCTAGMWQAGLCSFGEFVTASHIQTHFASKVQIDQLANLPMIPGTQTPASNMTAPLLIAGGVGAAWALGLLKGIL